MRKGHRRKTKLIRKKKGKLSPAGKVNRKKDLKRIMENVKLLHKLDR